MGDFFIRGFSLLVTGLLMVVILPALVHLFFSLGPVGFAVVLFLFFAIGSVLTA